MQFDHKNGLQFKRKTVAEYYGAAAYLLLLLLLHGLEAGQRRMVGCCARAPAATQAATQQSIATLAAKLWTRGGVADCWSGLEEGLWVL